MKLLRYVVSFVVGSFVLLILYILTGLAVLDGDGPID